jgi:hypothetical protein
MSLAVSTRLIMQARLNPGIPTVLIELHADMTDSHQDSWLRCLLSMDRLRRSAVADAEDVGEEGRGGWLCSQGSGMAAGRPASDEFMGQLEDLEFPRLPFFVGRMSRSSPPSDSVAAQRVFDLGVGNAANVAT